MIDSIFGVHNGLRHCKAFRVHSGHSGCGTRSRAGLAMGLVGNVLVAGDVPLRARVSGYCIGTFRARVPRTRTLTRNCLTDYAVTDETIHG